MARELPLDLIAEIVRLGEPIDWDANYIFQEILRAQAKEGIQAKKIKSKKQIFDDGSDLYPPLENPETPNALNADEIASILEYGGPFSQYFESYEHRPEQVEMLKVVTSKPRLGGHREAITEIGAVKFKGNGVEDELDDCLL